MKYSSTPKDLTGLKFNRLTVISFHHSVGYKKYWLCKCECGNEKVLYRSDITTGNTKSCGCQLKDTLVARNTTHGMAKTRFYTIWRDMLQRCQDKNSVNYLKYGAKGIDVVEEWLDFEKFKEDLYDSYLQHCTTSGESKTTLDRIDGTKGYYSGNCRWATYKKQNNNRRDNRMVQYNDELVSIVDLATTHNIKASTLRWRLAAGWDIETALMMPVVVGRNQFSN